MAMHHTPAAIQARIGTEVGLSDWLLVTQDMVDRFTVRTETEQKIPVVHAPPGSDVYLIARLWQWWPILELEKGKTYRLHMASLDWLHGFSLQPMNVNVQVHPGYDLVMTVKPTEAGEYSIMCNEFCGIGHHLMTGRIHIVDR